MQTLLRLGVEEEGKAMVRFRRALVAALALGLVVVATGCGSDSNTSSSDGSASSSSSSKSGLKVGFVYVSPIPGSAWSSAWDTTRKDLVQKYGAQTTVVQPIPEN